jgi:bifunctional non-homologous end joining protein LigD
MPGQAAGESPGFIAPMLAAAVAGLPPDAAEFVAEVKWDGLRACIAVAGGRVRVWSRNGRDITAAYPELGVLATVAGRRTLVLDGEIVALSGPRPDFTALQRRMTAGRPSDGLLAAVPVTLIVFDVLRSGRDHLVRRPYVLRRALLDDLGLPVPGAVQVPPAFPGEAAALLAVTREQGLEGIVLKRPASLYHPGRRTRDWLKLRNIRAVEVRVGGWLPGTGTGARARLAGSVLMGIPRPGALEFAGAVGSGLSMSELRELTALLESVEQPVSPFTNPLPPAITRHARWARPVITAEVAYLERTPSGRLRQPVWQGLRPASSRPR